MIDYQPFGSLQTFQTIFMRKNQNNLNFAPIYTKSLDKIKRTT
ncbi:MAG: hypothetical protein RLZZ628_2142 [Bacteroidota bacterium]|jgi:hypothetical protein